MQGPAVPRLEHGQSGYDPLGARQEAAFAQGLFLRNLLTGRLRTDKAWVLLVLALGGFMFSLPLVFTVVELAAGASPSAQPLCLVPLTIVAVLFFINMALSVPLVLNRGYEDEEKDKM